MVPQQTLPITGEEDEDLDEMCQDDSIAMSQLDYAPENDKSLRGNLGT